MYVRVYVSQIEADPDDTINVNITLPFKYRPLKVASFDTVSS
jgi:hypothetical protein